MLWHIVGFDLSSLDEDTRTDFEASLAALADIDIVIWLEVARDVDVPTRTGIVSLLANEADLEAYRVHPQHVPVVERARELQIPITRLDVLAPTPPPDVLSANQ